MQHYFEQGDVCMRLQVQTYAWTILDGPTSEAAKQNVSAQLVLTANTCITPRMLPKIAWHVTPNMCNVTLCRSYVKAALLLYKG